MHPILTPQDLIASLRERAAQYHGFAQELKRLADAHPNADATWEALFAGYQALLHNADENARQAEEEEAGLEAAA